jgi:hypothetical protein
MVATIITLNHLVLETQMFKELLQSQNYYLQYLTTLQDSMCTQNHERR